jgi:flagellar motor switch/type III secretory pathway protein FliN
VTEAVRDWLPLGAVLSGRVRATVGEVVADWSRRWFADGGIELVTVSTSADARRDDAEGEWRVFRAAIAVKRLRALSPRLLKRALGVEVEGLVLTGVDRRVVTAFVQRLLDDLVVNLEQAFELKGEMRDAPMTVADPFGPFGGLVGLVADGRDRLLTIAIPLAEIVGFCKSGLPAPGPRDELPSLAAALASTSVTIDATVGRAQMSLADLGDLAAGDVIVLDRALASGVEICIDQSDVAIASATLSEADGRLAFTLQARPQ